MVKGPGYSVAPNLYAFGEGYGFRKLRRDLDVTEFGVNVITLPPSYASGSHYHDEQQELYFVHRGTLVMTFGDGSEHELAEGGAARVDAATVRSTRNGSDTDDVVYLIVGAKGGYVGRDAHEPDGEGTARGPGIAGG